MIKRRFYKLEHGAGDGDGSSSSSDSESEDEVEEQEEESHGEEEAEDGEPAAEKWRKRFSVSEDASSGYDSEESSENEINCDSTEDNRIPRDAEPGDEDHSDQTENKIKIKAHGVEEIDQSEIDYYVMKLKSVFKCRICPRIVCLSENTLLEHLKSKRHARSAKLLKEGRLKLMLNSDGEIEEDQETHAERHARTIALAQNSEATKKKRRGRQRQRERRKRKSSKSETSTPKEEKKKRSQKP